MRFALQRLEPFRFVFLCGHDNRRSCLKLRVVSSGKGIASTDITQFQLEPKPGGGPSDCDALRRSAFMHCCDADHHDFYIRVHRHRPYPQHVSRQTRTSELKIDYRHVPLLTVAPYWLIRFGQARLYFALPNRRSRSPGLRIRSNNNHSQWIAHPSPPCPARALSLSP